MFKNLTVFIVAFGILSSPLYAEDSDKNFISATKSIAYTTLHETIIPSSTRALMSFPFDFITIARQINNTPYKEIASGFKQKNLALFKNVLKVHATELFLRNQSIYFFTDLLANKQNKLL